MISNSFIIVRRRQPNIDKNEKEKHQSTDLSSFLMILPYCAVPLVPGAIAFRDNVLPIEKLAR